MAIVNRRPRNASLRAQSFLVNPDISKKAPERSLLESLKRSGGRNNNGRITSRWRGGGAKKQYRLVDFAYGNKEVTGKVVAIEYDPNRNVPIALIHYSNGAKAYHLRPTDLKVGSDIITGLTVEAHVGNGLPLKNIPTGFYVHNVESIPRQGGRFARSAGSSVQLVAKEGDYAVLRMPSSEMRMVSLECWATVGILDNADYRNMVLGKAGRSRHLGRKPSVRGMAMNPVDHPHGGGEGRSKSGSHPTTPWGKSCKGARTRKRKSSLILKRRSK